MITTEQYKGMLAGDFRQWLKDVAPGTDPLWVDNFCDGLIARLSLQERLESLPKSNVNLWFQDTHKWQVNVDVGSKGAWSVNTSDDLLLNLVNLLKR